MLIFNNLLFPASFCLDMYLLHIPGLDILKLPFRIHGATVAEMPLIATCSRHRRQGMCRRLMNAIEEVIAPFKLGVSDLDQIN